MKCFWIPTLYTSPFYSTIYSAPLQYSTPPSYSTVQYTPPSYSTVQFSQVQYCALHIARVRYIPQGYIPVNFISSSLAKSTQLQYTTLYPVIAQYTPPSYSTVHSTQLQYSTLHPATVQYTLPSLPSTRTVQFNLFHISLLLPTETVQFVISCSFPTLQYSSLLLAPPQL
jgi:hypothetical protein